MSTMMRTYTVEVGYKKGLFDAFGAQVGKSIEESGITSVSGVRVTCLYRITGALDVKTVRRISREILLDRVAQEFSLARRCPASKNRKVIEVWYKEGVTDTVAETTVKAIRELGIRTEVAVRTGKRYYLDGRLTDQEAEHIAVRILANTLIEDYTVSRGRR